MRRILCLLLTMLMIFNVSVFGDTQTTTVVMQLDNAVMTVNDTSVSIDESGTTPVIVDGRTLVPIRAILEALGGEVSWNADTRQATLSYGEDIIVLTIDSKTAYINDTASELDTAPVIINGRTMLPIRFIAEGFGFEVEWNSTDKTITIVKTEEAAETDEEATVEDTQQTDTVENEVAQDGKSLIVYFSRTGTTESLANKIKSITGSDIVKLETVEPYPEDYDEVVEIADRELSENARPEIQPEIDNIEQYDTIYIGYPIWWGTMPMAMFTFIESYDLSGKTIAPFCTSASTGIGTSVRDLTEALPDSNVTEGLRGTGSTTDEEIISWIESFNN